jgi:hypothetical protein
VSRPDDNMRERARNRVDDDPLQIAAGTVAAGNLAADSELRGFAHRSPFSEALRLARGRTLARVTAFDLEER